MKELARVPFSIPVNHPSLPGHFPGFPVVPGAVILSEVISAVQQALGNGHITGFPSVKFSHPLQPDQACELVLNGKDANLISFELMHRDRRIATGSLRVEPVPTDHAKPELA